jgi:hypothetical protein
VRRSLHQADRAFRTLARAPGLVLIWWLGALPLLATAYGLVRRALEHGLPSQASELLLLLLWSCLVVLAWAWQLLAGLHLHQQAKACLQGHAAEPRPSLRRLLDLLPGYTLACTARLGASAVALVPLGAALPMVRALTAPWPVRAALSFTPRAPRHRTSSALVVVQVSSWLLLVLLTVNFVVLMGWVVQGTTIDAAALLPRLSDGRLWAVAGLLALSIVEPWRALALIAVLGLDGQGGEPTPPQPGVLPC